MGARVEEADIAMVVTDGERLRIRPQGQRDRLRLDRVRERGDRCRAPEQGREQRPFGRGRAVEVDRLASKQHRPVEARLDHGLGTEPAGQRDSRLVLGRLALHERDDAGHDGEGEQDTDSGEERFQPPILALLAELLTPTFGAARVDELALEIRSAPGPIPRSTTRTERDGLLAGGSSDRRRSRPTPKRR